MIKIALLLLIPVLTFFDQPPTYEIEELINRYNDYNGKYSQVRVHLELNQPKYAPGDTAYYKAYFLSYQFQPIKGNHFLTVRVLDDAGDRVHLQNIKVQDGKASNQLVFPKTLAPGIYYIEAFNDWMKNFDEQFYFRKRIVLAARRKVATQVREVVDSISWHPEGGYLVGNVPNSILVTSTKQGRGSILASDQSIVASFEIGPGGFTMTSFTPSPGLAYQARMDRSGMTSSSLTPTPSKMAVQLISLGECSPLQLHLTTPFDSPLRMEELYLVSTAYGRANYSKVFTLSEEQTTALLVPYRSLHDGLNQIYILNKEGGVIAERNYFLSPMYSQVEIKVEEKQFKPRDSVEIEVTLSDFFGNPIKGEFSFAVSNKKLFDADSAVPSMRNELYLFNDLPGLRYYFQQSTIGEEEWMKNINDLLISQQWVRSKWPAILSGEDDKPLWPFRQSLSFSGRMLQTENGLPVPDSTLVSLYQDKMKIIYSTYTKSNGEFHFPLINDYWNDDKFYYKVDYTDPKSKKPDYYLESGMIQDTYQSREVSFADDPDRYGEYMHNKRIIDNSFKTYLSSVSNVQKQDVTDPNTTYLNVLGGEDVEITIGDFVLFPTMGDLIHEVVTGLQYRRSSGVATIRVPIFAGGYTKLPPGDPLYIINGIFTLDTERFTSLKPEELVYMKIINDQNKLSKFGSFGRNGIVLVLSKEKGIDGVNLKSKSFELPGINRGIAFAPGNPTGLFAASVPHLGAAIYWIPNAVNNTKGKSTIKIKLPDDLGTMDATVSGVTFDGNPFSGSAQFVVQWPVLSSVKQ